MRQAPVGVSAEISNPYARWYRDFLFSGMGTVFHNRNTPLVHQRVCLHRCVGKEVKQLAISRSRKEELVAHYVDLMERSDAIFITEYKGMSVKEVEALRAAVREADGAFHVAKNTLIRVALKQSGNPIPSVLDGGQTGIGFALGEAPSLAKALSSYAKTQEKFVLRGGLMDEAEISADEIKNLAELPSLDELRATILGMVQGPSRNLASVIASGVRQVVNVVDAYSKKEEAAAEAA